MPNNYGGRSSFFDSPAGAALTKLSFGGGSRGGDAGGGMFESMRPSLRNAIADEAGANMLRSLDRQKPWMADIGPGLDGAPRQMLIDPAVADREEERQRGVMETMQDEELKALLFPSQLARQGATLQQQQRVAREGKDYGDELEARRYWDPMTLSMREDTDRRKFDLATRPAQIAADSRENVAETNAGSRMGVAQLQQPARDLTAIGAATRGGAFDTVGPDGKTIMGAPPAGTSPAALQRMMSGAQRFDPQLEAQITEAVNEGHTREQVIAYLRQIGRIK